jgi:hypothetical protein
VPESDVFVPDFELPKYWPRAYGFDVGWNKTAAPWGALDRETDTIFLYSEHYRGEAEPSVHAQSVQARGKWIHGLIDPAARGRSQKDGQKLFQNYVDLGLHLHVAVNAVEAGILEMWQRLSSGRLKVFNSLGNWKAEYRLYRRNEKGQIVKAQDHLMDATRYLVMSGMDHFKCAPMPPKQVIEYRSANGQGQGWME